MVMDLALLLERLNPKADKASGLIYLALSQPQCIHINGIDDNPIAMWKRLEEVHLQQTAQLSWPSLPHPPPTTSSSKSSFCTFFGLFLMFQPSELPQILYTGSRDSKEQTAKNLGRFGEVWTPKLWFYHLLHPLYFPIHHFPQNRKFLHFHPSIPLVTLSTTSLLVHPPSHKVSRQSKEY